MAVHAKDPNQVVIERAKDFWTRWSKPVTIIAAVIILVGGGWLGYKKLYKEPREKKAVDAIYRAEELFRSAMFTQKPDSFLKLIKDYSGTKEANLAKFYAGNCYVMLNDNAKALKFLEGFSTDSKMIESRAWKMLADIYAEQGKN